jgi:hypothetical protein
MIREALVNDAALFIGWKRKGVLRTRPVARQCHHLFDSLPFDEGSAHEPRENQFQQRPPASGPGTLVPAYAATIHKSQGSEYPAAIMPTSLCGGRAPPGQNKR